MIGACVLPANGPAQQWVMPNLAGAVLQDAQNTIQATTAGAIMDDNWKVCDQNIAPGAALSPTSKIDFGVVKLDETCP
jgi:hypothetical protein